MTTAGQRMAAATLAGLAPRDRAWMLARLPERDRRLLRRLLKAPELVALATMDGVAATDFMQHAEPLDDDATANPIAAASADALGASWAALWLTGTHPDLVDAYVASQPVVRAREIRTACGALGDIPPDLARALAGWPMEMAS